MAEKRMVAGINPALAKKVRDKGTILGLSDNAVVNDCVEECIRLMDSPGIWKTPDIVRRYRVLIGESAAMTPAVEALLNRLTNDVYDSERIELLLGIVDTMIHHGYDITESTLGRLVKFVNDAMERPAAMYTTVERVGDFQILRDHVENCFRLRNQNGVIGGKFARVEEARALVGPPPPAPDPRIASRRRASRPPDSA
jgi:hypothetical protein